MEKPEIAEPVFRYSLFCLGIREIAEPVFRYFPYVPGKPWLNWRLAEVVTREHLTENRFR